MSRQIQFRRGTSTEHENFTGAIGEITVDTTNKTLRVHDGQTLGGTILAKQSEIPDIANADYVVESQLPTAANNYTWYRKYKSGWVEQGGIASGISVRATNNVYQISITLPIEMSDTNYIGYCNGNFSGGNAWNGPYIDRQACSTTTVVYGGWVDGTSTITPNAWYVSGIAA
jgi:hypothetical protein